MNNKLNSILEHDMMCFRLQAARRKTRMQHEDFEKKLLALHRERRSLWEQKRTLGWVELKPPIMKGWKRYFVLRDDVAKSRQAALFEGILSEINTIEYSSRKDFKRKTRKLGKKIYVARDQQLLKLCENHFKSLKFTEKETQFFEIRYYTERGSKAVTKRYVFLEPWRFVLRVRPNMITKVRARDEEIERRLNEIDQYFERGALRGKLSRLLYGRDGWYWYRYEKEKERNPLKNKPLATILDELKAEGE